MALVVSLLITPAAGALVGHEIGGPDPATREWPEWPHEVSCDGSLGFDPVAAFSGRTNAEREDLASEIALRRFLAEGILSWIPKHSWRLVAEGHGWTEFAAGRLRRGLEWMSFQRVKGQWKWRSYAGGCLPHSLRHGLSAVTWELAADQPPLSPTTQQVRVNLGPGECNDGKSQNERVQKPEFREQNGKLLMTLWLRPVSPGFHTCVGLLEPPLVVDLPEPLGNRELMDGGTYPPRPAAEQDPER